jgi:hypothetical protein
MSTFASILVATLVLLLAGLLAPWHVRLAGRTSPLSARVELRLLSGLAPPIPIPLGRHRKDRGQAGDKPTKRARRARQRPMSTGRVDFAFAIVRAVRFGSLRLSGRFGLDDPADTGILWGRLAPFVYTLSGPNRRIELSPDFAGPCLDLEGAARVVVSPWRLLRAGLAFGRANMRRADAG